MKKKQLALSGALLLVPIAALAQQANTGDAEQNLPPVTVLSDKKTEAPKRKVKSIRQMVFSPVREHSRKPDEVRALIERYADGPRVELFARTKADGWMVWGNETSKFGAVA